MIRKIGFAAAAGAAILAVAGCGERHAAEAPRPAAATGERLTVRQAMIADLKPVSATVTTRDMAEARARIGGTLVRLNVRAGDTVRRGQVIGVVADQRIGLETRAYDAQAAAAEAQAVQAQAELGRIQDLYDHGVYAKARLDQAEAAAKAAQGNLKAARAQRAASAETGAQGVILAPSDGRVLRADTPPGSVVSPGQSIATVTSGRVLVRIELPEADARDLRAGQSLDIASQDLGPAVARATVVQVYPAVSAGKVTADLEAPGLDGRLIGQRVALSVRLGQRAAIVVPRRFIVTRFGVDYARVLTAGGAAADAPVQVARIAGSDQVEVLSGLNPGDVIVAPGAA
jgi:RND family efflux transporter MFP subunit